MKNSKDGCVALKRKGATYVKKLLSGKSIDEELSFWSMRTERLRSLKT